MKRYMVVQDDSASAIAETVERFLAKGWECQGGVAINVHTYEAYEVGRKGIDWTWAQAMVKTEDEP